MEIVDHPNRFIWTFGNHEPLCMYRRIGRKSTGGVPGSAQWLEKWHHWYDSEECAEAMANLNLNILHCRCYKGLGWEAEKEDYKNVVSFARHCRKRGIKVLAYIQHASVYPEIMRKEIPNLEEWCSVDRNGKLWNYLDSYWRWIPCPNRPGFMEYMDTVITRIVESGEFDGVLFDNMMNYPCYCPDCRRMFAEQLKEKNFDFLYPEFVEMPPEELPAEIMDPVAVEFVRFRHQTIANAVKHYRDLIKSINPEMFISANLPVMPWRTGLIYYNMPPARIVPYLDMPLSQTGNPGKWDGKDCVVSQAREITCSKALHTRAVPLNDSDAGGVIATGAEYYGPLFESLFGNTIPVDRIVMKPKRGGDLNMDVINERKPILEKLHNIACEYEDIFALPDYEPVALLYSEDALTLSKKAADAFLRCEESLMRNHIPYRLVAVLGDYVDEEALSKCSTLILPQVNCMSDAVVEAIKRYKGKLYLAGDENGSNDENYCERAELPFEDIAAGKISIPQHDVSKAEWRTVIHFVQDDWKTIFTQDIAFDLHTAAHPVVKMKDGKVAAILISAPTKIPAGKVTVPEKFRGTEYQAVTLDGTARVSFDGDQLNLPAFEGMLMIVPAK